MLRYFKVLIVNGYYEIHMKNILNVMNSFFCKEYGKEKVNYSAPTEKREVEAYNLGNRLAERSCKNIGAKLLSEQLSNVKIPQFVYCIAIHTSIGS